MMNHHEGIVTDSLLTTEARFNSCVQIDGSLTCGVGVDCQIQRGLAYCFCDDDFIKYDDYLTDGSFSCPPVPAVNHVPQDNTSYDDDVTDYHAYFYVAIALIGCTLLAFPLFFNHESKKLLKRFGLLGLIMGFCTIWIIIRTFAPAPVGAVSRECDCQPPLEQCICARETINALTAFELFCLANSRISAYMCYPLYMLMFLSMARNLQTWLMKTILVEFVSLTSTHHLHHWSGTMIGILVMWHGIWHLIRWGVQDNLQFVFQHQTGLTGFISFAVTPFIVWPMRLAWLRHKISFEVRKKVHYLTRLPSIVGQWALRVPI